MGDLQRGRAVRSVMYLLANYEDLNFYAVAPKGFQISPDLQLHLEERGVRLHFTDQLNEVLPEVDCVYMTRVQDEYDLSGESGKDSANATDIPPLSPPQVKAASTFLSKGTRPIK